MRRVSRRIWWGIAFGALGVILIVAGILAFNPWTANHFGYALSGANGLPSRISYAGRDYSAVGVCAGAGWCQHQQRTCWPKDQLVEMGQWPLKQVGAVPTLFGNSHPIMIPSAPLGTRETEMSLYVPSGSCYIVYTIEGGP